MTSTAKRDEVASQQLEPFYTGDEQELEYAELQGLLNDWATDYCEIEDAR